MPTKAERVSQFAQGATRSATANTLGLPVDTVADVLNLGIAIGGVTGHKLGILVVPPDVIENPVGGSAWLAGKMRKYGILSDSPGSVADALGEVAGGLAFGLGGVKSAKLAATPKTKQAIGAFGPIFEQYRGDAQGAVKKLMRTKEGEAIGAAYHPSAGPVDIVWGRPATAAKKFKDGYGLAKISQKHPEVLKDLQGFLNTLQKNPDKSGPNRIRLESPSGEAVISLDWKGSEKRWLLTAFEKD